MYAAKKSWCFLLTAVIFPLYNQCLWMWENSAAVTCKPQRLVIQNQEQMRHCFLSLLEEPNWKKNGSGLSRANSATPALDRWFILQADTSLSPIVYFMVNVFQHCSATTSATNKQWEYKCREGGREPHHGLEHAILPGHIPFLVKEPRQRGGVSHLYVSDVPVSHRAAQFHSLLP